MVARTGLFTAPVPGTPPLGTAPTDGRLVLGGLFGTTPQLVSGGQITQSTTVMQVSVGASVWQLPDVTNSAAVFLSPTDATTLSLAAGPSTGSRTDLIVVKQNNYENGDADSRVNVSIIQGVAGSPGVAPTVPAGYFEYASINVPAGASVGSACTITVVPAQPGALRNPVGGSVKRSLTAATFTAAQWTQLTNSTYWAVDQPAAGGLAAFAGTWVAPIAGVYDVRLGLQLDTTQNVILCLKKNDSTASSAGNIASINMAGQANFTAGSVSKLIRMNAGDYVAGAIYVAAGTNPIWNTASPDASFFSFNFKEALR